MKRYEAKFFLVFANSIVCHHTLTVGQLILFSIETTTIPEFSHLPAWWNTRARGLGGVLGRAVSCGGEENVLCLRKDRYYGDDIFFHEAAHGVAVSGMFSF